MRRIATVLLSVLLILSLSGCGNYSMHEAESDANKVKDEVKDDIKGMMPSDNNSLNGSNGSSNNSSDMGSSAKISAEQARKHALDHAKVSEKDARDFDVDKETHNGVLCFDIKFETDTHEYEYLIDANTGKVLNSKKENR